MALRTRTTTVHRHFDLVPRFASRADSANELRDGGALNEEECFIDATFVMAKGGLCQITFWLL
jgi:hypothetical protein